MTYRSDLVEPDKPRLTIYNMPTGAPLFDTAGTVYMSVACSWTFLVLAGMLFCVVNRNNPVVKIRCLPLSFGAILLLHVYWFLAQMVYPIGRVIPVVLAFDIQYFFMGIYFPLGIALFHASNLRFLHVAKLQRQFTQSGAQVACGCNGAKTSFLCRIRNMKYTARIMVFIGMGMVAQVILTVGSWFACMKYHPSYGLPGTQIKGANLLEQLVDLGRGWEWWPSVLWQVVWTWIVAPYLIWRAWGIRDTMGWRTQTIGCCLANLHATPMFLIASYVPAFEKLNTRFAPSEWIHLSIMFFEVFTVFVPVFGIIRLWFLRRKVNDSNAKWEAPSQSGGDSDFNSKISSHTLFERAQTLEYIIDELGDRALTATALDHILKTDPGPLQEFSALSDFSGENIAFLTRVAQWKARWTYISASEKRLDVFNEALAIYADFVSPRDAEFPLNLASRELKDLEKVFERAARTICGESSLNPVTPFDIESAAAPTCNGSQSETTNRVKYCGEIPEGFHMGVFDQAQGQIKYLVLTNTWPKFVCEVRSRSPSNESASSIYTEDSDPFHRVVYF